MKEKINIKRYKTILQNVLIIIKYIINLFIFIVIVKNND